MRRAWIRDLCLIGRILSIPDFDWDVVWMLDQMIVKSVFVWLDQKEGPLCAFEWAFGGKNKNGGLVKLQMGKSQDIHI